MNRLISLIVLLLCGMSLSAQTTSSNTGQSHSSDVTTSIPKTDLLSAFSKLEIDGPMNVVLKRVGSGDDVKIVYDTKGYIYSKFKASVNKEGILRVEERFDQRRDGVTDVTIYYENLTDVKIAHATAVFEEPLECRILDLTVTGGAIVTIGLKTLDTFVECTGKSSIVISGESRYFKINVSTAQVNGWDLNTESSIVDASHGADVRIRAGERLEAVTSTSAKVLYKGNPEIVRGKTSLFGGDILSVD